MYNFTSSIPVMVSAIRNDHGRPLPAVRSIELHGCAHLLRKSSDGYHFNFD